MLTCWQVFRALWRTEDWQLSGDPMFPDEVVSRDGRMRMFAEQGVIIRERHGTAVIWESNPFTFLVSQLLSHRLLRCLRARKDNR